MSQNIQNQEPKCSFCQKPKSQTTHLIAGPGIFICDDCVDLCAMIMANEEEVQELEFREGIQLLTPKQIKNHLDKYVIGQTKAKKALSVAVYNHYKRLLNNFDELAPDYVELQKSNVLMVGPTGTGKTLLAKTLAMVLNVPFASADATALTEAGYVGDDVETIITRLIDSAGGDIKKAERGIIYIDEIDKIARKGRNGSITRDVSGEGVQQALLKIIEGTEASVPLTLGRKNPNQEMVKVDTSNILFIVGGAFDGIEKIVEERIEKHDLGFANTPINVLNEKNKIERTRNLFNAIKTDDVVAYGIIPEFMGRLSVLTNLDPLKKTDMVNILTKPKNAPIRQYVRMFEMDGIKLEFDKSAIEKVVNIAMEKNTGARGLTSVIEESMLDIMFELPSKKGVEKVIINEGVINMTEQPKIITKAA